MGYQRITLAMQSPWNLASETTHVWQNSFHLSGDPSLQSADMEATALALFAPIARLCSPMTSLVSWSHYAADEATSDGTMTYTPGSKPGTGAGYTAGTPLYQQLEVCALARCPVKRSSTGKQVYLRKWIHDVSSGTTPNTLLAHQPPATLLAEWINGAGPKSLVPVDPTSGEQGGPWAVEAHLFTHQLRRGAKRKLVVDSNGILPPP